MTLKALKEISNIRGLHDAATTVSVRGGRVSVAWRCEACEELTSLVHHDEIGKLCGGCKRAANLVRQYYRAERQEVTRRRLTLAREGIGGYGS